MDISMKTVKQDIYISGSKVITHTVKQAKSQMLHNLLQFKMDQQQGTFQNC